MMVKWPSLPLSSLPLLSLCSCSRTGALRTFEAACNFPKVLHHVLRGDASHAYMMPSTWSVEVGNESVQPRCFSVTNEAVWWVSTAGVLYTWRDNAAAHRCTSRIDDDGAVPDPMALVQLEGRVEFLALSADDTTLVLLTSHHLSLYAIRRNSAPPPFLQESQCDITEDAVGQVEVAVEETERWPCHVADVRSGDVNRDASCAALCSASGLYVVNCAPSSAETRESYGDRVCFAECTALGATSKGCRFACFSGVTHLVLLEDVNHLLLLQCTIPCAGDASPPSVDLLVDGHVLTRTARATAMVCSRSAMDTPIIVVGFSTGQVRVVDGERLQELRTWDVSAALSRTLPSAGSDLPSSRGRRRTQPDGPPPSSVGGSSSRIGGPLPPIPVVDVQVGAHLFTVCTPQAIYYYHTRTFQLQDRYTVHFTPPLVRLDVDVARAAEDQLLLRSARNGSWSYTNVFDSTLYYAPTCVDARHADGQRALDEELATSDIVHASTPLPPSWLRAAGSTQRHSTSPSSTKGTTSATSRGKGSERTAATVRHPAKGSGYGDAPWSVQQERRLKAQAAAAKDRRASEFGLPPASSAKPLRFLYHRAMDNASWSWVRMEAATSALRRLHSRAVIAAAFDTAGDALVTAGGDGSVQHLRFPIAHSKRTGEAVGRALSGHPAAVTAVDTNLSRQRPLVLTGCADGKLRLWAPGVQETPLAECAGCAVATEARAAETSASPITCAQFFYLDKFVLSCVKDRLELRRHTASASASSTTAATLCSTSSLESSPVLSHSVGAPHTITSASAINHFASNLVVVAASNKELHVVDVAAGTALWTNGKARTRAIYRVAMGRTSRHASTMSNAAAHLFASASLDGTVALWDVRVSTPVQLYTQHCNSAIPSLAMELSPGSDMVAVASQDNSVYLYDIRIGGGGSSSATALAVLQGMETYVTALAWHPLQCVLGAGLANGAVHLFQNVG